MASFLPLLPKRVHHVLPKQLLCLQLVVMRTEQAQVGNLIGATARDRFDVVVLAQASMAPLETRLADLGIPVLSSPVSAIQRAVALASAC